MSTKLYKMLSGIRRRLHHYFLKQQLKSLSHPHMTTNIKDAQNVGILFTVDGTENNKLIQDFANSLRIHDREVSLLGYLDAGKSDTYYTFPLFNRKDLNWYLKPVSRTALDFIEKPFDILINLCLNECLPLEYVSAFSRARFRIGPYNAQKTYCYDLMLHLPQAQTFARLIDETMYYLQRV